MKYLKSHFWYNKNQRNGIFLLLVIILILQATYSFVDFSIINSGGFSEDEVNLLQRKIDSLKSTELENRKPKTYLFNPNYLTDYKASKLGMSVLEIDRLLLFRKKNKFVNSAKGFQAVTLVSDSLLNKISKYFKFPDWAVKRNQKTRKQKDENTLSIKKSISTTDINKATIQDFETIEGINQLLAQRIIKYREKLKGYTYQKQLFEVWKLDKALGKEVLKTFTIVNRPVIIKVNVNTATFKEVLESPYIDYDLCKKIFNYRDEVAELQSIEELKNIGGFPMDKYDRIVLYLKAE